MIEVITEKCVGCKLCIKACPYGAITMSNKIAVIDLDKCTLCGACVPACKFDAILLRKHQAGEDISAHKDVWVFCEQKKGIIQPVVYELLGEGKKLAEKRGVDLCAVLLGENLDDKANELFWRSADKVYLVNSPQLKNYQDEPYTNALVELIKEFKPEIVLCGATFIGRSLISRVAIRIDTGLTADCTGLDIEDSTGNLLQTRPAFGGNIMATIICPNNRPQMSTVRHKVMKEASVDKSRKGRLIKKTLDAKMLVSRTKLLDIIDEIESTVNLAEADIVVSGG